MRKAAFFVIIISLFFAGYALGKQSEINGKPAPLKPYLRIDLVYNFDVYKRPIFFLPKSHPSFSIWLEESCSGYCESIYVTQKAGKNKWRFADNRPESIPVWYGIYEIEKRRQSFDIDAISGATPVGEKAQICWPIPESLIGKTVDIYIEANNSFDFNDYYVNSKGTPGYSGANGQPSVIWKASIDLSDKTSRAVHPEIIGHGDLFGETHRLFSDVSKITTAAKTFHDIRISFVTR